MVWHSPDSMTVFLNLKILSLKSISLSSNFSHVGSLFLRNLQRWKPLHLSRIGSLPFPTSVEHSSLLFLPFHPYPHMDDITRKCASLSLNTKEAQTVSLALDIVNNSRILVAQLFTKCHVNVEALVQTLKSMWHSIQNFEVRDLGSNTVLIIFDDDTVSMKIFTQGPWSFDKYLIGLYKPKDDESTNDAIFLHTSFWVQIHNLPLRRMTRENTEVIGNTLGTVEQVNVSANGECRGWYIRVRVRIDIDQPLCQGRFVNMGETEPLWISF